MWQENQIACALLIVVPLETTIYDAVRITAWANFWWEVGS
jgi:hypothetical protein